MATKCEVCGKEVDKYYTSWNDQTKMCEKCAVKEYRRRNPLTMKVAPYRNPLKIFDPHTA